MQGKRYGVTKDYRMNEDDNKQKLFLRICERCQYWKAAKGPDQGFGTCRSEANKTRGQNGADPVLFPGDFGCVFFKYAAFVHPDYSGMMLEGVTNYLMEAVGRGYPGDRIVAGAFKVSASTLRAKFKEGYGCTMRSWHQVSRMERARELLLGGWAVGEVCKMLGASNPGNFSASFKRLFGVTMWSLQETSMM